MEFIRGIGYSLGNSESYVGAGISSDGGLSIGGSGGNKTNNTKNNNSGNSGGAGMSSRSFSSGDASVDQQSTGVALPLHVIGIPITLGFRKTKVKINIKKGFLNEEWGALYANSYNYLDKSAQIYNPSLNFNEMFSDYARRTRSMDVYSTRLPQPEESFIADNSKDIENINFTSLGYDSYNVAAQGLMGNMTPHVFQNATIFGKGQRSKTEPGDDIHVFWHHGLSSNAVQRQLGRLNENNSTTYSNNDFYFNFDGQFTSIEKNDASGIISNSGNTATTINGLINEGVHSGTSNYSNNTYHGRAKSPNYVEVFTNKQIENGHAALRGLISPATIPNSDRDNVAKFDPDGIGAYKITSPDGKTYHFSIPVYHFEQIHRSQIDGQEDASNNIANVNEKRQYSRYATHWLLTAVTGSDYYDSNNNGQFDKTDYGYWVELEYGKWSDGYVWRTPYQDGIYEYSTNLKNEIEDKDKGGYSFGRKQLYYLDKINTRNRTALFVKDIRYDALGKDLKFRFSNSNNSRKTNIGNTGGGADPSSLNYTDDSVYVREDFNDVGVSYKREYSLKLSKIVLVDGDIGKNLSKNTSGSLFVGYTPNDTCTPHWESEDFEHVYGPNYSYNIHNEQGVLDVNDVTESFITNNALQVVELNHSYKLAKNSPSSLDAVNMINNSNTAFGKLTLKSVQKKGKGGFTYMPPTSFNYYLEDMPNHAFNSVAGNNPHHSDIEAAVTSRKSKVDAWGFLEDTNYSTDNEIKAWSLKDITMPTGAKIEIDYEEDDYWTEAFARRYWENIQLEFRFIIENGIRILEFRPNPNDISANDIDFRDYFGFGDKAFLDVVQDRNPPGINNERYVFVSGAFKVESVLEKSLKFHLSNFNTHSGVRTETNCSQTPWYSTLRYELFGGWESHFVGVGGNCNAGSGDGNNTLTKFKLIASRVPEEETGGGLRVKELRTKDIDKTYKVTYDYNHPTKNRSSGITSYAPVDGLKYVPYQSEIPAPGVMYEYVTMKETSNTGDYDSETRYRHHVLKPVFNIFNPNIEMEALDAEASDEDNIFWANVTENYGGLNGANARDVTAKKIEVNINSALIGQIKSIENLNSEGHVMLKTENQYINGTKLVSQEPNKGYTKETFNSMKSVFTTNTDGTIVNDVKRLLSISSKTEYNNMLKKTITTAGGQQSYVEYSDVDPWLSSFRKSETTMADGTKTQSIRVPAYDKYTNMQSKVINPTYKNMLTQEAMSIKNVEIDGSWKTVNANVTTWKDTWGHVVNNGQTNTLGGLWRKHQNFVWKDNVDTHGTYGRAITSNSFNWGIGAIQTNTQWQRVSEITKYTLWSSPVETMDINGTFAASKMADNFSKTIAAGNARYTEMYYSGAEYVYKGNTFEGDVLGANYRTQEEAHTGSWSVKNTNTSNKVFEINKAVNSDISLNALRPGKYRVSFWVKENNALSNAGVTLTVNGNVKTASETVDAGCWKQYNYTVTASGTKLNLDVKAIGTIDNYFDDFRMHPIASTMSSYVYNQNTDELIAILGANNMASVFCYDAAGRLCTSYAEVANQGNNIGGFKVSSKNKYNYQGIQNNYAGCDCIVDYCNDNDFDKDGVLNASDNCPNDFNPDQADEDNDGVGNICDMVNDYDTDGDGVLSDNDNCPSNYNPNQEDDDNDGIGNVCDTVNDNDTDGDGVLNSNDNCPNDYNPNQEDDDNDGLGNVCDSNNNENDVIITNNDLISFYYVNEGFTIGILTNDIIPDKEQVKIVIVQEPKYGTLKIIEAAPLSTRNDYIYYKVTNFHNNFSDSFTYKLEHTDGYSSNVSNVNIVWRANP
ncbi:thrombospondin type 3 repeat-containing protein [Thalassobellus citreus]|uniref:thrombospondin type 3 repeat-containing protein n=1 Tax=Thalassobellus citreus TaxID=3367752 RepID=UPI0037882033